MTSPVPAPPLPAPPDPPGPGPRPPAPLPRSAHTDTFSRDRLPPPEDRRDLRFDLPELRYPQRLNCAQELLDGPIGRFGGDRPCPTDQAGRTRSCAQLPDRVDRVARLLVEFVAELPYGSTGKPQRAVLRAGGACGPTESESP